MSKPKIWAYCEAGCRWETVHKSDFARSASIVRCEKEDLVYTFEAGKTYKIKKVNEGATVWGFAVTVSLKNSATGEIISSIVADIDNPARYEEHLTFKVCGWDKNAFNAYVIVYEVNGTRVEEEIGSAEDLGNVSEENFVVEGYILDVLDVVNEVYLYNDGGEVQLKLELAPPTVSGETLMFHDWRASVSGETLSLS